MAPVSKRQRTKKLEVWATRPLMSSFKLIHPQNETNGAGRPEGGQRSEIFSTIRVRSASAFTVIEIPPDR